MEATAIKTLLSSNKLKATESRVTILNAILGTDRAVSLSEIQKAAGRTDRVTVYRTLQTLEENGIIHKAYTDSKETFYAGCDHDSCSSEAHSHSHVHFKCTECGTIRCLDGVKPQILTIPGFFVQEMDVSVKGTCADCK